MPKYVPTTQTPQTLAAMAQILSEQAEDLRAVSAAMDVAGFPSLTVMNGDQRKKGLAFIEKFTNAVRSAVREEREKREDFGKSIPGAGSKKGRVSGVSGKGKRRPKTKDLRLLNVSNGETGIGQQIVAKAQ
jgi:hypothetical protein